MLKMLTRSRVIQAWFVSVALVVVAGIASGAPVTVGTGALLLALSLVHPAIVLMLWQRTQPATAAEVIPAHARRRRRD